VFNNDVYYNIATLKTIKEQLADPLIPSLERENGKHLKLFTIKIIKAANQNPVDSIADKTPKYIVAFLNIFNGTGGSIYWGIIDSGTVSGVKLSREQHDEIGKKIDNKFG